MNDKQSMIYKFLPKVFLRASYYSFSGYDLSRIPEVLQEQVFRNAVWLASPEFYHLLEKKNFDFRLLKEKEKHTLYKYYNRMCYRPTPFGSFASFTLADWGREQQIRLADNKNTVLHLLPDQQLLYSLRNAATPLRPSTALLVNPTLYRFGREFRYTKSIVDEKGNYSFFLEAISAEQFNSDLFSFIRTNKITSTDVLRWITNYSDCTDDEALEYLGFLIKEQAIYSEARGNIIGSAAMRSDLPGWNKFWENYHSVNLSPTDSLSEISGHLNGMMAERTSEENKQLFYAASERAVDCGSIDALVQEELLEAVRVLNLLSVYEQPKDLSDFINEFRVRFDREKVPLLTALDPDSGLPYGNTIASEPNPGVLANIEFPETTSMHKGLGWNKLQQFLFRLWIGNNFREPWSPLQIDDENMKQLYGEDKTWPLPQSQALMYRNTGEHLIIEHSGGASGVSLIGRFSCFSEEVHLHCCALAALETEGNPGVIFADIAQFSNTHVDNINRRLPVYPFEIPINVFPAQPQENLIFPSDLLLSFQDGELILESIRLGKRVIPRLTTAYNFRNNNLPVFRLLCDMQFQSIKAGLSFNLESFFPGLSFYPRVSYKRVILSLAKWHFTETDLGLLIGNDSKTALNALSVFRKTYSIPRYISTGTGDQQLVFDLAQAREAEFFLKCLTGLKHLTITEYLLPDRSVQAGRKPLAGQLIAFLVHNQNIYKPIRTVEKTTEDMGRRNFLIGSNWLYIKLYCVPRAADTILAEVILPFLISERTRIKNWFFIRYSENGYHLRLRIQAEERDLGVLLVALKNKLESGGYDKLVRNYQGDTYQREIERYGQWLINDVERFFRAGSALAIWIIKARQANKPTWDEFELALISATHMISHLLPVPETRLVFIKDVVNNFLREFKADKAFKIAIDNKYREMRTTIADVLEKEVTLRVFRSFLDEVDVINKLIIHYPPEKKSALLADLVHMQLNRTFSIKQREQELLVYYCLQKHFGSLIARNKLINHSV